MIKRHFALDTAVAAVLWALLHPAAAQITVSGLSDRTVYANQVTYSVQIQSGYAGMAWLDGREIPIGVSLLCNDVDYHLLSVAATNLTSSTVTSQQIQFIVRSTERLNSEWGLRPWQTHPIINSATNEFAGAHLRIVMPHAYPQEMEMPVVAWVENDQNDALRANGRLKSPGHPDVQIRRGVGFGYLSPNLFPGLTEYEAGLASLYTNKLFTVETNVNWMTVGGSLTGTNEIWPENSRIAVTGNLTIETNSLLTIGPGVVVRLNPGVNIYLRGSLHIDGSADWPVVFAPVTRAQPWGGIITTNDAPAQLTANYAFFVGTGADANWFSNTGYDVHLRNQACILFDSATARMTNCFLLDGRGQMAHGDHANLIMDRCLGQRFLTGGEYAGSSSYIGFFNSAFLEFPADDGVFADDDNDALYFTEGVHELVNTLVGFAKDDCLDSGSGNAGSMYVSNCWLETTYHEGMAWSGTGRTANSYDTVVLNCGQGIEAGWSGGSGTSPAVFADRCLTINNSIGLRFGDNYDWTYNGFLTVTNSIVLNNYRDVWGMQWDNWNYRTGQMRIEGNWITAPNSYHPNNAIWDPATDGWRLAAFKNTPADGPVGMAFAVRTNRFDLSYLTNGIPVGLSIFSTNFVTVNYTFESGGNPLTNGVLTFAPGEVIQRIHADADAWEDTGTITVSLSSPENGELTGLAEVTLVEVRPAVSLGVSGQQHVTDLSRGIAVNLDAASARTVSVHCLLEGPDGLITNRLVTFDPGQSTAVITFPDLQPESYSILRVQLEQPFKAVLALPIEAYFVNTAIPATANLIVSNSWWHYFDQGFEPAGAWESLNYDVSNWGYGPAEIGYGESDQNTTVRVNNPNNRADPAYYFRHLFYLDPSVTFNTLSLWLRYDDGAVVYINGAPVLRAKMPNGDIGYLTWATGGSENTMITSNLNANVLVPGTNIVAVEVHQDDNNSSDISFALSLTGSPPPPPPKLKVDLGKLTGNSLLFWNDQAATLQAADDVNGPWFSVTNSGPYTIPMDQARKFYRLVK